MKDEQVLIRRKKLVDRRPHRWYQDLRSLAVKAAVYRIFVSLVKMKQLRTWSG